MSILFRSLGFYYIFVLNSSLSFISKVLDIRFGFNVVKLTPEIHLSGKEGHAGDALERAPHEGTTENGNLQGYVGIHTLTEVRRTTTSMENVRL